MLAIAEKTGKRRRQMLENNNNNGHGAQVPVSTFFAPLRTSIVPVRGTGAATFVRATTATVVDHEGMVRRVLSGEARFHGARRVSNLSTYSEDLTNAEWNKATWPVTISANDTTAPDGAATADKVVATATNERHAPFNSASGGGIAGRTYTISAYLKYSTRQYVTFGDAGDAVWRVVSVDIQNGTLGTQTNCTATIESVGNGWYRVSVTFTRTNTGDLDLGVAIGAASTDASFQTVNAAGTEAFYLWGAQVEDVTGQSVQTVAEYVSTNVLSAPYHGAGVDGVRYFDTTLAGVAIPPTTLLGYLSEYAVVNLALRSEEFDNAAWAVSNVTKVADAVASPDGATTADTLTASAGNGTVIQDLGVIASAVKTFSVWLKRKTGSGNIDLTLDGGATWTTVVITSSWARYSITQTLADPDCGIRIVTNADAVWAWGAQVEAAAFASSYIPTTTAAVTRNSDVLTYPTSGNIANAAGTACAEVSEEWTAAQAPAQPHVISTISGNEGIPIYFSAGALRLYDGTAERIFGAFTASASAQKLATRWSGSVCDGFVNGAVGTQAAFDGSMGVSASVAIGCSAAGNAHWVGTIRNVRLWLRALSDSEVKAL